MEPPYFCKYFSNDPTFPDGFRMGNINGMLSSGYISLVSSAYQELIQPG